jgi:hypothetical protein
MIPLRAGAPVAFTPASAIATELPALGCVHAHQHQLRQLGTTPMLWRWRGRRRRWLGRRWLWRWLFRRRRLWRWLFRRWRLWLRQWRCRRRRMCRRRRWCQRWRLQRWRGWQCDGACAAVRAVGAHGARVKYTAGASVVAHAILREVEVAIGFCARVVAQHERVAARAHARRAPPTCTCTCMHMT